MLVLIRVLPNIIEGRVDRKLKESKRANRGAVGEERIGDLLSSLTLDDWVLHDIECPNGNIDHIIISKTSGVFLIETKAHGGKVEINGDILLVNGKTPEKDFIAQTLRKYLLVKRGNTTTPRRSTLDIPYYCFHKCIRLFCQTYKRNKDH